METNTGVYVDEYDTGTDPDDPDTDGDGAMDGDELSHYSSSPTDVEIWVDFAWGGNQIGTLTEPFGTIPGALGATTTGQSIFINGSSSSSTTNWTGQINNMTSIFSYGGSVAVGE